MDGVRINFERDKGMVLVVIMLFLSIASLFAICFLNMSLLETKMGVFYKNRIQAFYKAEELLVKFENEILTNNNLDNAEIVDNSSICGVTFYRVVAEKMVNGTRSRLQSIIAKVDDTVNCGLSQNIKSGRQSFLERTLFE